LQQIITGGVVIVAYEVREVVTKRLFRKLLSEEVDVIQT
jgi:hypothetical protein